MKIRQLLSESPSDKGAFKALFVSGPPGAGKTSIKKYVNLPSDIVVIDADTTIARVTGNSNYDPKRDKSITMAVQDEFTDAVNDVSPLLLDTVGNNERLMMRRINTLQRIGYDVAMIWVDVEESTSHKRIKKREEETGRKVDPDFVSQVHQDKKYALPKYQTELGANFMYVSNETEIDVSRIQEKTSKFFNSPVQNPKGQELLAVMKKHDFETLSPKIIDVYDLSRVLSSAWKP